MSDEYHLGLDIIGSNLDIHPAASGKVVFIQENDTHGCAHTHCVVNNAAGGSGSCTDHGFGNTVIVEHDLPSGRIYTQYSHLSSISPTLLVQCSKSAGSFRFQCNVPVSTGDSLGRSGGTGYGVNACWSPHLHFEVKTVGTLASTGNDTGDFGYSTSPPDSRIYLDPILALHNAATAPDESISVVPASVPLYRGPGGNNASAPSSYGSAGTATGGQQYKVVEVASYSAKPSCPGWYGIAPQKGVPFRDPSIPGGILPFAWVCENQTAHANEPPQGSIDSARLGLSSGSTIHASITAAGWAADPDDGSPVSRVAVLLDGKVLGSALLGGLRPDVAAAYPLEKNWGKSGWTAVLPIPSLAIGNHTVSAVAYDTQGASTNLGQKTISVIQPTFTISPASGMQGTTFRFSGANFTGGGSVQRYVTSPNGKLQVLPATLASNAGAAT